MPLTVILDSSQSTDSAREALLVEKRHFGKFVDKTAIKDKPIMSVWEDARFYKFCEIASMKPKPIENKGVIPFNERI